MRLFLNSSSDEKATFGWLFLLVFCNFLLQSIQTFECSLIIGVDNFTMADYVLALCCKHFGGDDVLFVLKDKPVWQKGRLNLPGGKIEDGETPEDAAIREVIEETGYNPWLIPHIMGILQDGDSRVFCLKVIVDGKLEPNPRPEETQEVFWKPWYKAKEDSRLIPNLRVIVSLMRWCVDDWVIKDEYRSCDESHHSIEVFVPTKIG